MKIVIVRHCLSSNRGTTHVCNMGGCLCAVIPRVSVTDGLNSSKNKKQERKLSWSYSSLLLLERGVSLSWITLDGFKAQILLFCVLTVPFKGKWTSSPHKIFHGKASSTSIRTKMLEKNSISATWYLVITINFISTKLNYLSQNFSNNSI